MQTPAKSERRKKKIKRLKKKGGTKKKEPLSKHPKLYSLRKWYKNRKVNSTIDRSSQDKRKKLDYPGYSNPRKHAVECMSIQ
jgi:transcription initiation factor TFIIIB Brf1 subunit/transcription initiation factor TFIIB